MHLDHSEYSTQSTATTAQKVIATPDMPQSGLEFKVILAFFAALVVLMFFIFFYHCYIKHKFHKKSIKARLYAAKKPIKKSKSIISTSKPFESNNNSREALIQKNKNEMTQSKRGCIQFPMPLHKPGNDKMDINTITALEAHEAMLSVEEGQIGKNELYE